MSDRLEEKRLELKLLEEEIEYLEKEELMELHAQGEHRLNKIWYKIEDDVFENFFIARKIATYSSYLNYVGDAIWYEEGVLNYTDGYSYNEDELENGFTELTLEEFKTHIVRLSEAFKDYLLNINL